MLRRLREFNIKMRQPTTQNVQEPQRSATPTDRSCMCKTVSTFFNPSSKHYLPKKGRPRKGDHKNGTPRFFHTPNHLSNHTHPGLTYLPKRPKPSRIQQKTLRSRQALRSSPNRACPREQSACWQWRILTLGGEA